MDKVAPTRSGSAELPRPFGQGFLARPHTVLAALGRDPAVLPVQTPAGRRVLVVTADAAVRAGLVDRRLSLRRTDPGRSPAPTGGLNLLSYSPADHARVRRVTNSSLSIHRVAEYRPVVWAAAVELLGKLSSTASADLLSDFARPYAFRGICDVLGIDQTVRDDLYLATTAVFAATTARGRMQHAESVHSIMALEIAARTVRPTLPGVLSSIVAAAVRAGDVTDAELVSLAAMLLLAGLESTAQMICMSVLELADWPQLRLQLAAGSALVAAISEELLRLTTPGPFATARYATENMLIAGCPVPAGAEVLLSLVAANRDATVYDWPDRLDPTRQPLERHLTFGRGPHICPGASLARMELTIALEALFGCFPRIAVVGGYDAVRWHGSYRHRRMATLPVELG